MRCGDLVAIALIGLAAACSPEEPSSPNGPPKPISASSGGQGGGGTGGAGAGGDASGGTGGERVVLEERVRDYEGVCSEGARAEWTLLSWKATTPGDSKIVFLARTADTLAELDDAEVAEVATAKNQSGNANFTSIGAKLPGEQSKRWLRMTTVLYAATGPADPPVIDETQVMYDCVQKE